MRIVEQSRDRLVLHQDPTTNYIVAIIVFLFGAFALCFTWVFAAMPNPPLNAWLAAGIGVLLLTASVLIWLAAAPTLVTFDRLTDTFRIERRGRFTQFELSERLGTIMTVELEEHYCCELHCRVYRLIVRLAGGKMVPLSPSFDNYNLPRKHTAIAAIQSFLRGSAATTGPADG